MPDKEGSDDEKKSTKSVVKKKQKQFMNQEELDLTKIAEAFGGYVVESLNPSKDERERSLMARILGSDTRTPEEIDADIEANRRKTVTDRKTVSKVLKGVQSKAEKRITAPKPGERSAARNILQKQKSKVNPILPGGKKREIGPDGLYRAARVNPTTRKSVDQVKSDIEFKDSLRKSGASGDFSPTMPQDKREAGQKKRDARIKQYKTPDPFDPDYDKKAGKVDGRTKTGRVFKSTKPVTTSLDEPKIPKKSFKTFSKDSGRFDARKQAISDLRASDRRLGKEPSEVQQRKGIRDASRQQMRDIEGDPKSKEIRSKIEKDPEGVKTREFTQKRGTVTPGNEPRSEKEIKRKVDRDIEDKIKSVELKTPKPTTDFGTGKLGKATDVASQAAKKSRMATAIAKGVSKRIPGVGSAAAGAEAGLQAMKGDLGRAARTAAETLPVVGPAFTVANVMRDMKDAELARKGTIVKYKEPTGMKKRIERLPMRGKMALGGAVAGATALSPMMLRRGAKKFSDVRRSLFPSIRGGTVGRRSAKT